jgi:septal ring factor EnvC (AmiA/AmiB activator)
VDAQLKDYVAKKSDDIYDLEKKIQNAEQEIDTLKDQLWRQYVSHNSSVEKDISILSGEVSKEYRKSRLSAYTQAYKSCARQILSEANQALETISRNLVSAAVQGSGGQAALKADYSTNEKPRLDEIWTDVPAGSTGSATPEQFEMAAQAPSTQAHIKQISDKISELLKDLP